MVAERQPYRGDLLLLFDDDFLRYRRGFIASIIPPAMSAPGDARSSLQRSPGPRRRTFDLHANEHPRSSR
jgi:hypothetical protein